MVAGIIGVPCGALLSTKLKLKFPRADPIICGMGLAITTFLFFLSLMWGAEENIVLAFVLIFVGEISLNLNWSIVADMLLYVVSPTRRGTAEAVQILVSHALGDAGSPFLIGIVSIYCALKLRIVYIDACFFSFIADCIITCFTSLIPGYRWSEKYNDHRKCRILQEIK